MRQAQAGCIRVHRVKLDGARPNIWQSIYFESSGSILKKDQHAKRAAAQEREDHSERASDAYNVPQPTWDPEQKQHMRVTEHGCNID